MSLLTLNRRTTMVEATYQTRKMTTLIRTMTPRKSPPCHEEDDTINLLHRLGFTDEATTLIIGDHGLSTFDQLRNLDDARCKSLMCMIHKTRLLINPDAFVTISDLATCNLQLAMYTVKHFDRTSRVGGAFDALLRGITPESIADLSYQRKQEEYDAKETPTLPKSTLDGSCVAKSFEALNELLGRYRSISGISLSYVVHNIQQVRPSREDPPFGTFHSIYSSYDEEMIRRAP